MKQRYTRIGIGAFAMVAAFLIFFCLNLPTAKEEVIRFASTYKEKQVELEGTYYEVADAEYAVLICPGYSCDRQKWRVFADLFVKNGFTTMVFDYAGQGASSSTIGFDNARTDAIPAEIDDALAVLRERSGLDYDHILLVGHSMGGRAILRLLYDYNHEGAVTTVTKKAVRAAILLSPEVNYSFNAQASLFAGTADDVDPLWSSFGENDIAGTDVYLFGSTADDIVSDENVLAIYAHLGAEGIPASGCYSDRQINSVGSVIGVGIVPGVLHSYQMYSSAFAEMVNEALTDITGKEMRYAPKTMSLVYLGWALALVGVGLLLSGLVSKCQKQIDRVPKLMDSRRFLKAKLLLWIPGLVLAFGICCICVVIPFGSPVMNLPYMCGISGYGLLMLFCYRKGAFPGTEGKLPPLWKPSSKERVDTRKTILTLFCVIGICFFVWYVLRSSMYRLIPFNTRLFWVCFAGMLMTIGYYVSGCESDMLKEAGASGKVTIIYNLIQYVALFLLILFYLVIKSYSGLIGQVQNMILMYVFCIPLGDFIRRRTCSRAAGAFVTGFVFQTLMITSAALIAIF